MAGEMPHLMQALVRTAMILAALAVVGLLLVLPAMFVFAEAFAKGAGYFAGSLAQPETVAAIRVTLIVAAISVSANTLFGLAAAWAIARFEFPGKSALWLAEGDKPLTLVSHDYIADR